VSAQAALPKPFLVANGAAFGIAAFAEKVIFCIQLLLFDCGLYRRRR
jgi:hypothetical protein